MEPKQAQPILPAILVTIALVLIVAAFLDIKHLSNTFADFSFFSQRTEEIPQTKAIVLSTTTENVIVSSPVSSTSQEAAPKPESIPQNGRKNFNLVEGKVSNDNGDIHIDLNINGSYGPLTISAKSTITIAWKAGGPLYSCYTTGNWQYDLPVSGSVTQDLSKFMFAPGTETGYGIWCQTLGGEKVFDEVKVYIREEATAAERNSYMKGAVQNKKMLRLEVNGSSTPDYYLEDKSENTVHVTWNAETSEPCYTDETLPSSFVPVGWHDQYLEVSGIPQGDSRPVSLYCHGTDGKKYFANINIHPAN